MDDDLLEHELHWQPPMIDRRWFKTNPAGVNAMNAIAGLLWLAMLVGYLRVKGTISTEQGLAPADRRNKPDPARIPPGLATHPRSLPNPKPARFAKQRTVAWGFLLS